MDMVSFYICLIAGAALVGFIIYDFFYTTLSFNGAGPLAKFTSSKLSAGFHILVRKSGSREWLRLSGIVHVLFLISIWIGMLWLGLFIMLAGGQDTVVHSGTGAASDLVNKFYFSGYVLSTMGNGDFAPGNKGWQIVIALFSFSGFIFITTGISYLVNLTSAVLFKRTLSLDISNLGETPEEIILNTCSENSYSPLIKQIPQLRDKINRHHQNHYAYPAAHEFYSSSRTESVSLNLAVLDEALTFIRYRVQTDPEVTEEIRMVQDAVTKFLDTLSAHFITGTEIDSEVSFHGAHLLEKGVHLREEISEPSVLKQRRALLNSYLISSGWEWEDIYRGRGESELNRADQAEF